MWNDEHQRLFARVLYDGELMNSLSWVPLEDLIDLLKEQVPDDVFERCMSASGKGEGVRRVSVPFIVQ